MASRDRAAGSVRVTGSPPTGTRRFSSARMYSFRRALRISHVQPGWVVPVALAVCGHLRRPVCLLYGMTTMLTRTHSPCPGDGRRTRVVSKKARESSKRKMTPRAAQQPSRGERDRRPECCRRGRRGAAGPAGRRSATAVRAPAERPRRATPERTATGSGTRKNESSCRDSGNRSESPASSPRPGPSVTWSPSRAARPSAKGAGRDQGTDPGPPPATAHRPRVTSRSHPP